MTKQNRFELSSTALHIIAMVLMLCDHLWATVMGQYEWLTCIGRIAFPIFAFMVAEGYAHTSDVKKYAKRMFVFALISEIPFNLMVSTSPFYPIHQNVMWTLLMGLGAIHLLETTRKKGKWWLTAIVVAVTLAVAYLLGYITFVDYYGAGIITIVVFYVFRKRTWYNFVSQAVLLYWINTELLGGLYYPVQILGMEFELIQQSIAVLALIPIWLYKGRQGYTSKTLRRIFYWFYPVHMLILAILMML